jgi:hypothetical protein
MYSYDIFFRNFFSTFSHEKCPFNTRDTFVRLWAFITQYIQSTYGLDTTSPSRAAAWTSYAISARTMSLVRARLFADVSEWVLQGII